MADVALALRPTRAGPAPGLDVAAAGLVLFVMCWLQAGETGAAAAYWEGWADQSKYLASARAFASGDLAPARHWYPLIYPLTLAPLVKISAFLSAAVIDASFYALTYLGFRAFAERFGVPRLHAFLLFAAATLLGSQIATAWIVPWTTTPSAALIWLALARVAALSDSAEPPAATRTWFTTGLLLGLIPLCRPADAVVAALLGLFLLPRLASLPRLAALAAGGLAVIAAYAALHLAIYGLRATDYMTLSAAYGFDLPRLAWKAQTLLIYPGPFFPNAGALTARYPWLLLGAAGLIVALVGRRRLALLLALPVLAYVALMLTYEDLTASNFWTFRLVHYFKWTLPAFALFAYAFLRDAPRRKALSAAALGLVAATGALRYEPVAAGPDEPAALLVFKAPGVELDALATGRAVLADRAGPLRNLLDFHQFPDGRGFAYAQASRRDFQGGEVWRDPGPREPWPVMGSPLDDAPPPLAGAELKPLARYRAEFALGWPCWLGARFCAARLPAP